jgi:hypothetical protein
MGMFERQDRACPKCGQTFSALALWDADVPCETCSRTAHDERMARIRAGRNYTIEELGGACPTQAQGRTVDDRPYYFRARHGTWTLQVGQPEWPTEYRYWPTRWDDDSTYVAQGDDDTHGWMEDEAVLAILDRHLPVPSTIVKDRP